MRPNTLKRNQDQRWTRGRNRRGYHVQLDDQGQETRDAEAELLQQQGDAKIDAGVDGNVSALAIASGVVGAQRRKDFLNAGQTVRWFQQLWAAV